VGALDILFLSCTDLLPLVPEGKFGQNPAGTSKQLSREKSLSNQ
jgi:hypothetical protein